MLVDFDLNQSLYPAIIGDTSTTGEEGPNTPQIDWHALNTPPLVCHQIQWTPGFIS